MTLSIPLISTAVGSATNLPNAATLSLNPAIEAILADDAIVNSTTIGNQALATSLAATAATATSASTAATAAQSTANTAATSASSALTTANAANSAVTTLSSTVTSQGVQITNNTTAIAALGGANVINPAGGAYGTWDTTGATDVSATLQAAVNAACAQRLPLMIPPGLYLLNSTVQLTPARNTSQTIEMIGVGAQPLEGVYVTSSLSGNLPYVVFLKNFNNGPAFDATGYRYIRLANFAVQGLNAVSQYQVPNRFDSNYVINGARDSQYSPDCGISLDGLVRQSSSVALPPDGGYPSLTSSYTTSNLPGSRAILENVTVAGHVVGFAITMPGTGSLTDQTTFKNCGATCCKVALAMGQAQSKITIVENGNWGSCQTVFDGLRYGVKAGCSPTEIHGCNFGYAYELFNMSAGGFEFTMHHCYTESVRRLGSFGNGGGTNRSAITLRDFTGGTFTTSGGIPLPPVLFETFGPATLDSMNFGVDSGNQYSWNLVSDTSGSFNSPITLHNCTLKSQPTAQLMPFIGYSGSSIGARLRECYSSGTYPSLPLSDDSTNDVSTFSWNNRVSSVGIKGTRYSNGTSVVDYITANTTGSATLTVSALTLTTTALTLTTAPSTSHNSGTISGGTWGGTTNLYPLTLSTGQVIYAVLTNGSATVNWINGGNITGSPTTSVTVGNVSLTFTYSGAAGTLQVGDVLMWQHTEQTLGGTGSKRTVPTWLISTVAGASITATPITEASCIDTVANNPSNSVTVLQNQWAPYGQNFSATATSSSASLTSNSPTTGILNGDWLLDTAGYLPTNTRVVSGAGTATLTLNNAATGSGSTNLYFGEMKTPTLTATWT